LIKLLTDPEMSLASVWVVCALVVIARAAGLDAPEGITVPAGAAAGVEDFDMTRYNSTTPPPIRAIVPPVPNPDILLRLAIMKNFEG
jgi:hypothetical protein